MVQGQSKAPRISSPIKEEETKGDNIDKSQGNNLNYISHSIVHFSWSIKFFSVDVYAVLVFLMFSNVEKIVQWFPVNPVTHL